MRVIMSTVMQNRVHFCRAAAFWRALIAGLVSAALALVLASCGDGGTGGPDGGADTGTAEAAVVTATPAPPREFGYRLEPFLSAPIFIQILGFAVVPGAEDEAVVIAQHGRLWRVSLQSETPRMAGSFGDVTDRLVDDLEVEMGLLGLAFPPDFPQDSRVFLHYTADDPRRSVISWFPVANGVMEMAEEHIILEVAQPGAIHNGGQLAFGPDGLLYVALGDGGFGLGAGAQDLSNLLGSILRLDVSGDDYEVPPDNPFVDTPDARPEIYAYGFRNPWRFSFDRETGDLWTGDVGEVRWEEIDRVVAGGNYGWGIVEGNECFEADECATDGFVAPRFVYRHPDKGGAAVIGGFVYQGAAMPELAGWYVYGDFLAGKIWALNTADTAPPILLLDSEENISSFGELPDGELIVLSYRNAIFRLARS